MNIVDYESNGTGGEAPIDITLGPDGDLWFTEDVSIGAPALARVGRMTASGSLIEYPLPTSAASLGGIVVGPDGELWFTETYPGNVGRISTTGQIAEYPIVNGQPVDIATGPDGALWVTDDGNNSIDRITTTGQVSNEFPIPTQSAEPTGISAGPDGALWFTESSGGNIGRVSTLGIVNEYPIANSVTENITTGGDGALWFTDDGNNSVGRITTNGSVKEYPIPTAGVYPNGIALGPDGALWFTEGRSGYEPSNSLGRITTGGAIFEYPCPLTTDGLQSPIPGALNSIIAGPGGLWFTETTAHYHDIVRTIGNVILRPVHVFPVTIPFKAYLVSRAVATHIKSVGADSSLPSNTTPLRRETDWTAYRFLRKVFMIWNDG